MDVTAPYTYMLHGWVLHSSPLDKCPQFNPSSPFGSVTGKAARKTFLTTLCLDGLGTLLRKLAELIIMHL
jgi:hypothetical protein